MFYCYSNIIYIKPDKWLKLINYAKKVHETNKLQLSKLIYIWQMLGEEYLEFISIFSPVQLIL